MPEQASKLPTELFSLEGQIAVVTGGTGVLGGAMGRGLARAGAKVGVLGRRRERAEAAVRAIEKDGGAALALPADVLDRGELGAAREAVLEQWRRLDTLVNAADLAIWDNGFGDGSGDGFLILDDDDSGHTRRIRNRLRRTLSDDVEI